MIESYEEEDLEKRLSIPRDKSPGISISIAYRAFALGKILFGRGPFLRFLLNASWLLWRFAFELSGELHGSRFHNRAKALNEAVLKKWTPAGTTVIDIGCGIGRWCEVASKYADRVVGIDFDADLIEQARNATSGSKVEYLVGDVTKDLRGRKFDVALLTHVLEHIENADKILGDLKQVADTLLVEVPDFEHDPLNWIRLEHSCPFYSDGDHVLEYTEKILVDQLNRTGWQLLELRKCGGAILAVATRTEINE